MERFVERGWGIALVSIGALLAFVGLAQLLISLLPHGEPACTSPKSFCDYLARKATTADFIRGLRRMFGVFELTVGIVAASFGGGVWWHARSRPAGPAAPQSKSLPLTVALTHQEVVLAFKRLRVAGSLWALSIAVALVGWFLLYGPSFIGHLAFHEDVAEDVSNVLLFGLPAIALMSVRAKAATLGFGKSRGLQRRVVHRASQDGIWRAAPQPSKPEEWIPWSAFAKIEEHPFGFFLRARIPRPDSWLLIPYRSFASRQDEDVFRRFTGLAFVEGGAAGGATMTPFSAR